MAKITFSGHGVFFEKLQEMEKHFCQDSTLEKAVYAGATIVTDKIRKNLESLPEENFRNLPKGEVFQGIPAGQKKDLLDSFGLAPVKRDRTGFVHTKAGFDGYGRFPTESYPYGVPNQLVAAATESGSSVRQKLPFIRPAVTATRKRAIDAMEKVVDDEIKKII